MISKKQTNSVTSWILLGIFVVIMVWDRGLTQVLAVVGIIGVSLILLSWKDNLKKK